MTSDSKFIFEYLHDDASRISTVHRIIEGLLYHSSRVQLNEECLYLLTAYVKLFPTGLVNQNYIGESVGSYRIQIEVRTSRPVYARSRMNRESFEIEVVER